ncbi:hypothetical protein HS125_21250 [bacterium]|nr:hypothetical protein [bacterium]MBE7561335.1 hypothetical protein [bacterium]
MMVVLWVVAVVAVLLCPPWEYRVVRYRVDGPAREVGRVAAGYHFVWAPPRFEDSALHTGLRQEGPTVAWGRLSLFVAAMSLPLAVWVWRRREQRVS